MDQRRIKPANPRTRFAKYYAFFVIKFISVTHLYSFNKWAREIIYNENNSRRKEKRSPFVSINFSFYYHCFQKSPTYFSEFCQLRSTWIYKTIKALKLKLVKSWKSTYRRVCEEKKKINNSWRNALVNTD